MACFSATTLNLVYPIVPLYPTHHHRTTVLQKNNLSFLHQLSKPRNLSFTTKTRISATFSQTPSLFKPFNNPKPFLSGFTRTASNMFPSNNNMAVRKPSVYAINPAFLASMTSVGTGTLNVPVTHLAAGIAKWLDLYVQVLTVRILLSWYPNLPWMKQPFSAIRNLCDPYLNLFRSLVPPSGTLDFSSIIALMVLTTLSKILNSNGMVL